MLKVRRLQSYRGGRLLFSDLTFSLQSATCLIVQGPNGAGKTTLLKILCGLLNPDQGVIEWQGTPLRFPNSEFQKNLIYIGQTLSLKRALSPLENLQWWLATHGVHTMHKDKVNLDHLKKIFIQQGLGDCFDLPSDYLSTGQCRRVLLLRLMLHKGKIWILDEPLNALDKQTVLWFMSLLIQHLQSGGLAIISTHRPLELQTMLQNQLQERMAEDSSTLSKQVITQIIQQTIHLGENPC